MEHTDHPAEAEVQSETEVCGYPPVTVRERDFEIWPLERLRPNRRNARRHSKKQIAKLAAAIRRFGFVAPVLVDEGDTILAGHGRLAAAALLGIRQIPVVVIRHLDAAEKRLFTISDNRLAELSSWDDDILRQELQDLEALNLDIDIEISGFEGADLDRILSGCEPVETADPADACPESDQAGIPVSRLGDLWILGEHRLICGNARTPEAYAALLGADKAQMVFTDPPYGVPIRGHVSGLGRHAHREFVEGSEGMDSDKLTALLCDAARNLAAFSADGAIHFICMDWRHQLELLTATAPVYGTPKQMIVWVKSNAGMGSFYRSEHELIYVFKVGEAPHINNFGLGEKGRYRTNVWKYPGVNSFSRTRDAELADHPTPKNVAMVADAIKDCSKRNGIILDAFGGGGTTLIAAERTKRRAYLIELDPLYCDVIIRRWEAFSKGCAHRASDERSFQSLAAEPVKRGDPREDSTGTLADRSREA